MESKIDYTIQSFNLVIFLQFRKSLSETSKFPNKIVDSMLHCVHLKERECRLLYIIYSYLFRPVIKLGLGLQWVRFNSKMPIHRMIVGIYIIYYDNFVLVHPFWRFSPECCLLSFQLTWTLARTYYKWKLSPLRTFM